MSSSGLLPVRSSPNLGRDRYSHGRAHSLDHHQYHQHQMGYDDSSPGYFGGAPDKAVSSGRPAASLDYSSPHNGARSAGRLAG
jgi:hypothetical protein